MARQSIPANPVDEQILALQRQVANCQNDMEAMREQLQAASQQLSEAGEAIEKLNTEKRNALSDMQMLHVPSPSVACLKPRG